MPRSKLRMKIADVRTTIVSGQRVAARSTNRVAHALRGFLAANQARRVFSGDRSGL